MLKWWFSKGRVEEHFDRGNQLAAQGDFAGAVAAYTRAAQLRPDLKAVQFNLGSACRDSGELAGALVAYERAAQLDPGWADAHFGVGITLSQQGRFEEAVAALSRALAAQPDMAQAHFELGNAHTALGNWREAIAHLRSALALDSAYLEAQWALAMAQIPAVYGIDTDPAERRRAFEAELETLGAALRSAAPGRAARAVAVHQPFFLAYQETSNRELLTRYGKLCAEAMRDWQAQAELTPVRAAPSRGRPRVGIVSAQIHDHSVWSALVHGWIENFDLERFDLRIFHLGTAQGAETRFARSRATEFHDGRRDFGAWARLICDSRPDVLIYPEIGMDPTTTKLASMRLAPKQAASWGHPETTGLPSIDYFLSAQAMEPPQAQAHYSEELVALPNLGCRPVRHAEAARPGELPALEGEGPLLVCAGTPFKYAPQFDGVLVDIVRRLQRCRLVFLAGSTPALSDRFALRLRARFAAAGVDWERNVLLLPRLSRPGFRALLERADLYLDTLGFSGFITAMLAVESGLPVVAREGRFLRGRLAAGPLGMLGLAQELVAPTDQAYADLAVALARDPERRRFLRSRIEAGRDALFEDSTPLRALQDFLERAAQ